MSLNAYPCPHCGSALEEADGEMLRCPSCGIGIAEKNAAEFSRENECGSDSITWDEYDSINVLEAVTGECVQCGTVFAVPAEAAQYLNKNAGEDAAHCPFCDSVVTAGGAAAPMPDLIVPFKKDRQAAEDAFLRFCSFKPLLPKGFAPNSRAKLLKKVYVPLWVMDCSAKSKQRFEAEKTRTKRGDTAKAVQTDTFMALREGSAKYKNICEVASTSAVKSLGKADLPVISGAEPFSGKAPEAMTVVADIPAEDAHKSAAERVRRSMNKLLADSVKGYTRKKLRSGALTISDAQTKLALFPMWIVSTKYKKKTYRFIMNGCTGKTSGELPFSRAKLAILCVFVTAGIAAVGSALSLLL